MFLRNLSPDARKLILGRRYNRQKTKGHGQGSAGQNEPQNTAERLAAEHHVSPATVKRAGKFAEEADKKPEVAKTILTAVVDRTTKKRTQAAEAGGMIRPVKAEISAMRG